MWISGKIPAGIFPDIHIQPFYFSDDAVYLQANKDALIYAREVRDWDSPAIPERDFILEFAEQILGESGIQDSEGMQRAAIKLTETVALEEDKIIRMILSSSRATVSVSLMAARCIPSLS